MGERKTASARRGRVVQAAEHRDFTKAGGKGKAACIGHHWKGCLHQVLLAELWKSKGDLHCQEGNSEDGGRGKTQKHPRQREVLTKPWSFPERSE